MMEKETRQLLPVLFSIALTGTGLVLMTITSLTDPQNVGLSLTLKHYLTLLNQPDFWHNTVFSLYLAVAASLLSTVVGTLTAFGLVTSESLTMRRFSEKVMQAGLVLPYLYVVFLAFLLLGQTGLLSRLLLGLGFIDNPHSFPQLLFDESGLGMIWVYVFKGIPFVTLMTLTVMAPINRQYRDVAKTMGAGGLQQLLKIYLPLSRNVILWSSLVIFAFALGSFEVTYFMSAFSPRPMAAHLYSLYLRPGITSYHEAMAFGTLLLVFGALAAVVYLGLLNLLLKSTLKIGGKGISIGSSLARLWLVVLTVLWLLPMGYLIVFSFFATIPFPTLLPRHFSFQFWEGVLGRNPLFFSALLTSLQLAVITGLCAVILGVLVAKPLSRMKQGAVLAWFSLASLPLFVPAMLLSLSLHLVMLRLSLANSKTAVLTAHVVISLPYAVAILSAYLTGIGSGMEDVAKSLGSSPFQYYRKVALPLLAPGLFFAFCIGFLLSFSELFSVLLLGGGNVLTLTMLMYPAMNNSQWGTGAVLGTLFLIIHLALFFVADHWVRRGFSTTDYLH